MSRDDTFTDCRDYVDKRAPESFARHVLTERRAWTWKVAQPDSWVYGFFLMVAPGAVIVYGDIGEAIFRMHAGSEHEALDWVLRCSKDQHYVMSKLSNREAYRRFYPGDALAYARRCVAEATDAKRQSDAEMFLDELSNELDGLSGERFYLTAQDHGFYDGPACTDWAASAFWFAHALQCFAKLKSASTEPEGKQ